MSDTWYFSDTYIILEIQVAYKDLCSAQLRHPIIKLLSLISLIVVFMQERGFQKHIQNSYFKPCVPCGYICR